MGARHDEPLAARLHTACATAQVLLDQSLRELRASDADHATRRLQRARVLLERAPLPIAVFTANTREPRFVNAAWHALFGTRDPVALPVAARAPFADVVERGTPVHVSELEFRVGTRPGWCEIVLEPCCAERARPEAVIVACADITDAVIARKLRVPREVPVWTGERGDVVDYCNPAWRAYSGWTAAASLREAVHVDDHVRCSQAIAQATRLRAPMEIEARLRRADGGYRWHRLRFVSSKSDARWFGTATDIHETHCMESELSELSSRERAARADAELANSLKDQFLAIVSHELRAPLTTMLLWEKVLRDPEADAELRTQALDAIRQSAEHQSRLVGDLLDVSRATSGKLRVDLRPVDVARVVEDAILAVAPAMCAKGVTLHRTLEPIGIVNGDTVRLRQVMDNLLSNAVKFTCPGGRVTVSAGRRGRMIAIEVADSGRGIAAEFLPRLFEPFSQVDDALTRGEGGLGLGLAIARQLVTLHGGTLEAASPGPGKGATFTVTLPISDLHATSSATNLRAPALDQVHVLVVDDDHRVRDALAALLRRAGAIVDTAESAEAGRQAISPRHAVLLCDIAMPAEDGYDFIRKLRAAGNTLPAIALTAHASLADAEHAERAGFDRHFIKPIDFDRLVESINEVIAIR